MERFRSAEVCDVSINLRGPYDLSKLESYNFKRVKFRGDKYHYRFDGAMHKYRFIPISANYYKITIRPKRIYPPSYITFNNISSECNKWVHAVMLSEEEILNMLKKALEETTY